MKTRRWLEKALDEAKKEQVTLPWSRGTRDVRVVEKPQAIAAAE